MLRTIPNLALESVLIRQLRRFKAKMVFKLTNKNNNLSENALVYFASLEDLKTAKASVLYYFHNRLKWSENEHYNLARDNSSKENRDISKISKNYNS